MITLFIMIGLCTAAIAACIYLILHPDNEWMDMEEPSITNKLLLVLIGIDIFKEWF